MTELSSLVLRFIHDDGDHVFRVAKLRPDAVADLRDRLMRGANWYDTGVFGPPPNLSQAVDEINTRDFKVLDIEAKEGI